MNKVMDTEDKISQLVEWVAEEIWCRVFPNRTCRFRQLQKSVRTQYCEIAKQILSHHDLALIEDCDLCKGEGYLPNDDTGEPNPPVGGIRCPACHETGIIPIPLAKVLKSAPGVKE